MPSVESCLITVPTLVFNDLGLSPGYHFKIFFHSNFCLCVLKKKEKICSLRADKTRMDLKEEDFPPIESFLNTSNDQLIDLPQEVKKRKQEKENDEEANQESLFPSLPEIDQNPTEEKENQDDSDFPQHEEKSKKSKKSKAKKSKKESNKESNKEKKKESKKESKKEKKKSKRKEKATGDNAEVEEEPDQQEYEEEDERTKQLNELDAVLKSASNRRKTNSRKKVDVTKNEEVMEDIVDFIDRMNLALRLDIESNRRKEPALERFKMLSEVRSMLTK